MPSPNAAGWGSVVAARLPRARRRVLLALIIPIVGGQCSDARAADPTGHSPNYFFSFFSTGILAESYLDRLVSQVDRPARELGFREDGGRTWIRSLDWSGDGWSGCKGHDWKYTLHMQEGALLFSLQTGRDDLRDTIRGETELLLSHVTPAGAVTSMPDAHGTAAYEYGEAMSVLGLSALFFRETEPVLASRCLEAGGSVLEYAANMFPPSASEESAVLLARACRLLAAGVWLDQPADSEPLAPDPDLADASGAVPMDLEILPNPICDRARIVCMLPSGSAGRLSIIDAAGRRCFGMEFAAGWTAGGVRREVIWNAGHDGGRQLPSGHYRVLLETKGGRRSAGIVLLRGKQ